MKSQRVVQRCEHCGAIEIYDRSRGIFRLAEVEVDIPELYAISLTLCNPRSLIPSGSVYILYSRN